MKIVLDKEMDAQMKLRKMSVSELSKRTRIPYSTLLDWKHGRKPSSKNIHLLLLLSNFFEITLSQLLFGISEEKNSDILFTSTFRDGNTTYKLTVEKIGHIGGNSD